LFIHNHRDMEDDMDAMFFLTRALRKMRHEAKVLSSTRLFSSQSQMDTQTYKPWFLYS